MSSSADLRDSDASKLSCVKCATKFVVRILKYLDLRSSVWNVFKRKLIYWIFLYFSYCILYYNFYVVNFAFVLHVWPENYFALYPNTIFHSFQAYLHLIYHLSNARVNLLSQFWDIWIFFRCFEIFFCEKWANYFQEFV